MSGVQETYNPIFQILTNLERKLSLFLKNVGITSDVFMSDF